MELDQNKISKLLGATIGGKVKPGQELNAYLEMKSGTSDYLAKVIKEEQASVESAIKKLKSLLESDRNGLTVVKGTTFPLSLLLAELARSETIKKIAYSYQDEGIDLETISNIIHCLATLMRKPGAPLFACEEIITDVLKLDCPSNVEILFNSIPSNLTDPTLLSSDLADMILPDGTNLDVSWYPSHDIDGNFLVTLYRDIWENKISEYETRDIEDLKNYINKTINKKSFVIAAENNLTKKETERLLAVETTCEINETDNYLKEELKNIIGYRKFFKEKQ